MEFTWLLTDFGRHYISLPIPGIWKEFYIQANFNMRINIKTDQPFMQYMQYSCRNFLLDFFCVKKLLAHNDINRAKHNYHELQCYMTADCLGESLQVHQMACHIVVEGSTAVHSGPYHRLDMQGVFDSSKQQDQVMSFLYKQPRLQFAFFNHK